MRTVDESRWDKFDAYIGAGYSLTRAAKEAGINYRTARGYLDGNPNNSGVRMRRFKGRKEGDPVPLDELKGPAKRALDDIALFGRRYFGLMILPWQEEAADDVVKMLASPYEEYVVENQPPGTGKSTWWARVLCAWLTCRDRRIRGMVGSSVTDTANQYLDLLRMDFDRKYPVKAKATDLRQGIAKDAEATLSGDYGRFRPIGRGVLWMKDRFRVQQHFEEESAEKEPNWTAFGIDSAFLGGRYDFIIWDDLFDPRKMRTGEAREHLKEWFDTVALTRLEPGGLFILQGQRLGPDDIYRYALQKKAVNLRGEEEPGKRMFRHIVYKAHYDDRCKSENHLADGKPFPKGCLLYPRRLPFAKLETIRLDSEQRYQTLYQQQDVDPARQLVQKPWITGETLDEEGFSGPGCLDFDRGIGELPKALKGHPCVSLISVDPSPTRKWGILWMAWFPKTKFRYVLDIEHRPMQAPDLLDWNYAQEKFEGLLESWWSRSAKLGIPVSHVIVERNGAQRFLLQYDHVRRWMSKRRVAIIPHDTHAFNKDSERGVWTIRSVYRYGQIRLPWRYDARPKSEMLIEEVQTYPDGRSDDLVISHWQAEFNLPKFSPPRKEPITEPRPSFVREYDVSKLRAQLVRS